MDQPHSVILPHRRTKKVKAFIVPNLNIWICDARTKQVVGKRATHNHITDLALQGARDFWGHPDELFTPARSPNYIAVGTDDTTPTDGDTALGGEVHRNLFSRRTADGMTIIYQMFLDTDEANGNDLKEAGVFNLASSGDLWLRAVYNTITKTSSISITYQWEITMARG